MAELNPPLGTTTPEIFMDNVKRADELVNGPAGTVDDRGGEPLDTWRQMMAKNDEVRQNLIPLSKQYATLAAAQADIANIPAGSTTYVRSQDGSALADEYMNVSGMLTATGRKMPSQAYVEGMQGDIDSLNQMRITLSDSLSDTWRDDRDDKTEVVLVA
ncbi:right-handed parallel beta-helix repeat-containing protein, partial [Klebsiella michiganensis]